MKNLKVNWPTIIAIAIAVSFVSCQNEKMIEDYNSNNNIQQVEKNIEIIKEHIHNIKLDDVVIPEGLDIETNEEEAGFSK